MTYLFLDTEWADVAGSQLVSLALVSEDGTQQFYAEMDPLPNDPTGFVRGTVYPLLDRGITALSEVAFTTALRAFVCELSRPTVLADYHNDLALLKHALAGFNLPGDQLDACGPLPDFSAALMLKDGITQRVLEDWFTAHSSDQRRRHHAAVDAHALRMTWLAVTGRVAAPWSPALLKTQGK